MGCLKLTTHRFQADERLRKDSNVNHEYLPIAGLPEFIIAAQKLMLGAESPAVQCKRVSQPQALLAKIIHLY